MPTQYLQKSLGTAEMRSKSSHNGGHRALQLILEIGHRRRYFGRRVDDILVISVENWRGVIEDPEVIAQSSLVKHYKKMMLICASV